MSDPQCGQICHQNWCPMCNADKSSQCWWGQICLKWLILGMNLSANWSGSWRQLPAAMQCGHVLVLDLRARGNGGQIYHAPIHHKKKQDSPIHFKIVTIHTTHGLFSSLSHTYSTSFPHLLHPDSYLSHLWLIVHTLAPLWLISLTLMTHRSHTYSTLSHLLHYDSSDPYLYFYYIYS